MEPLTLAKAIELRGQTIKTFTGGYAGQDYQDLFVIGEIVSSYQLAERRTNYAEQNPDDKPYANYAEYWESYMPGWQLEAEKNRMELITAEGRQTYILCDMASPYFKEPTFTCSDADRVTFFEVIN